MTPRQFGGSVSRRIAHGITTRHFGQSASAPPGICRDGLGLFPVVMDTLGPVCRGMASRWPFWRTCDKLDGRGGIHLGIGTRAPPWLLLGCSGIIAPGHNYRYDPLVVVSQRV